MPKGFYQLYLIHAFYEENMIPCVFCLLTGKGKNDYKSLFMQLKEAPLNITLELKPMLIMVDFELAAMNAFKYHLPTITVLTCLFHLRQSFYRKLVEIG